MSDKNQKLFLGKKLIFTTFIVIMTVCLLEMGLRISGYIILKLNPPSNVASNVAFKIKDKDEFVILCLGDSYTFGLGTDYQHSYPRQLERILNEKHSQRRFKVYNLGIPGSNSSQLANNLLYNINKYNPDLLIVMTGQNDIWNLADINCSSLLNRLDSRLNHIRVYKLVKIIGVNLRGNIENRVVNRTISKADSADSYSRENKNIKRKKITVPEASQQIISGHNFVEQGRYDLAEGCFLKALQLDPNNVSAYRHLGTIYREQAKYGLAEKCLKEVLAQKEEPEDLGVYLELGMIYRIQKKYRLAKRELKKAVLDPGCTNSAFIELSQVYKDEEEFYKDIENFKKEIKDKDILARIDKLLKVRRDEQIVYKITRGNLIKINGLSKKNNTAVIFQTYPTVDAICENIRKIAKQYRIPLVDNHLIFQEIFKSHDRTNFLVSDEHCSTEGYRIIAENIYKTLIKHRIIDDVISKTSTN